MARLDSSAEAPAPSLFAALDALRRILARLGSERDLERLYAAAVREAVGFFNVAQCALVLNDAESGRWWMACAPVGIDDEQARALEAIPTEHVAQLLCEWPEPGVMRLLDTDHAHLADLAISEMLDERDVLLAQVRVDGHVLGVLRIANRTDGALFSPADMHLLGFFAGHLATLIHGLRLLAQEQLGQRQAEQAALAEKGRLLEELESHLRRAERRSQELAQVARSSACLSASLNMADVLHNTVSELGSALHVDQVGLVLFDWAAGYGKLVAEYQERPDESGRDARIPVAGNLSLAKVIETKAPLAIRDVHHDPLMANIRDVMQTRGVKSILLLPLIVHGEIIGTVGLDAVGEMRDFAPAEIELAQTITNQAAAAIANAQLLEDARRRAMQLETIQEVTNRITAILDVDELLFEVAELLAERFGYYHVHVFVADEAGGYIQARAGTGEAGRKLASSRVRLRIGTEGICGHAAGSGQTLLVNDVSQEARYQFYAPLANTRAEMAVPMKLHGRLVGVLDVLSDHVKAFDDTDRFLVETLADQVAIALENARLFGTVQERARQLAQAYDELKALDRMKDEFVQTVSHELRTPLTFVKGYVELLLDGDLGDLNAGQTEALRIVLQRSENVVHLVNDIISLLRAESMQLTFQPVDLAAVARASIHSASAVTDQADIDIEADIEADLPKVRGDVQRLTQVFDNLLGNAIKFSPDGGTIRVALRKAGQFVQAEVCDHGIGIPADLIDRIWERFYQVDSTTTRRFGGTGLGLAIVKRLIEAHGGQVGVESIEGQGSTFYFTVPVDASG